MGNIGLIYKAQGDLETALGYYQDALGIHKEIGYRLGEANQLGDIGLIYCAKGDLDTALKYHQDALTIHQEIGYKQGEASQLGNIGLVYINQEQYEKAFPYSMHGFVIADSIGTEPVKKIIGGHLATIREKVGEEQFKKWYEEFMEQLKNEQDTKQKDSNVGGSPENGSSPPTAVDKGRQQKQQ